MSVTAPSRPRGGLRRRLDSRAVVPAALALVIVAVGVLLAHYALRLWIHSHDEDLYRRVGEFTVADFPRALWDTTFVTRGTQRLDSWIIGATLHWFGAPGGFRILRAINILAYCSTAVAVARWARSLGVGRGLQVAAGALAILVPWAIVTTSFLTENLAYPATTWALYAIWRAAVRPGGRTVAVALLAIAVAMLARSVMVALLAVLAVAMALVWLRHDARATWVARRELSALRVLPWALAAFVCVAGAAVYLVDREALHPLLGVYAKQGIADRHLVVVELRRTAALIVSGTGILPGVIAAAWVARSLVLPRGRESFALALLLVAIVALSAYGAAQGGLDERYIMYPAPLVAVAAAVAIGRREVGLALLAAAALAIAWLFSAVAWNANPTAFGYFTSAAETFHARVMLLGLGSRAHLGGLGYGTVLALATVAAAVLAGLALRLRARRAALAIGLVLGLGVAVTQVAQLRYVEQHFTAAARYGPSSLDAHTWVDAAQRGRGDTAFFIPPGAGSASVLLFVRREIWFWNPSAPEVLLVPGGLSYGRTESEYRGVGIDPATGRLRPESGTLPSQLVEFTMSPVAPLVGRVVATGSYVPARVVRVAPPARVAWWVTGTQADDAWTKPRTPAVVHVYRGAGTGAGDCLDVALTGSPYLRVATHVTVRSAGHRRTLELGAGQPGSVRIPLRPGGPGRFADVVVTSSHWALMPDLGYAGGVRFSAIARTRCR